MKTTPEIAAAELYDLMMETDHDERTEERWKEIAAKFIGERDRLSAPKTSSESDRTGRVAADQIIQEVMTRNLGRHVADQMRLLVDKDRSQKICVELAKVLVSGETKASNADLLVALCTVTATIIDEIPSGLRAPYCYGVYLLLGSMAQFMQTPEGARPAEPPPTDG